MVSTIEVTSRSQHACSDIQFKWESGSSYGSQEEVQVELEVDLFVFNLNATSGQLRPAARSVQRRSRCASPEGENTLLPTSFQCALAAFTFQSKTLNSIISVLHAGSTCSLPTQPCTLRPVDSCSDLMQQSALFPPLNRDPQLLLGSKSTRFFHFVLVETFDIGEL